MKMINPVLSCMLVFTIILFYLPIICFASIDEEIIQIEEKIIDEIEMEDEWLEPDIDYQNNVNESSNANNTRIRGEGRSFLGPYKGLTYYSQADSKWANKPYTSTNNPNQTMKSSGCGPTAAAIVVSSSIGSISPVMMADLFVENGFRTPNNGTAWSAFPFIANYFAFNNYEYTTSFNTAIEYLRKGYYVIVSCGNGLFTTNGHYIVLVGIDGNTLLIYDTYMYNGKFDIPSRKGKVTINGNTINCSIDNFKKYANYRAFWCYSNDNGTGSTNSNSSITSDLTTGAYTVTASILRVRSGPGTNYKIVARIKKGSQQTIDKINGNWGHLSNNSGWICLDYCNKINASDSPPKDYISGVYQVATNHANLRIRKGPGTIYKILGSYKKGSIVSINYTKGNWGHLSNNKGWICLDYCKRTKTNKYTTGLYRINTSALRVRSGPGTNYRIITRVYRNSKQKIDYINGKWGHLSNGAGWICLDYCVKI